MVEQKESQEFWKRKIATDLDSMPLVNATSHLMVILRIETPRRQK